MPLGRLVCNLCKIALYFAASSSATYDYVVIDTGTARATIVSRLLEQEEVSVAMVETDSFFLLGINSKMAIAGRTSPPR